MVDHDLQIPACCQFDQLFRLRNAAGEWLFHKDMLAVLQRRLRKFVMGPYRSDDRHCVNVRGFYDLGNIARNLDSRVSFLNPAACRSALIADGEHLCAIEARKVSYY